MNSQLENYARLTLKESLNKCTQEQQRVFKQMYSHKDLDAPINIVVDSIPERKLDFAMQQVERTLAKKQHNKPLKQDAKCDHLYQHAPRSGGFWVCGICGDLKRSA